MKFAKKSSRQHTPRTVATLPIPLTEEEELRVLQLARKDSLEEAVQYAITHMRRRCDEAGIEPAPINELERLALQHRNANCSSASSHLSSARREVQVAGDNNSIESENDYYSADESKKRNVEWC